MKALALISDERINFQMLLLTSLSDKWKFIPASNEYNFNEEEIWLWYFTKFLSLKNLTKTKKTILLHTNSTKANHYDKKYQ